MIMKSPQKQDTDARTSKIGNLQSSSPEVFGNSSVHQSKFNNSHKVEEMNTEKANKISESLTMS